MNINKIRLVELFFKLRTTLINNGKFHLLSDKVISNIETAYFFNNSKSICLYNHCNSPVINKLLNNSANYFKNIFVFPKLNDDKLEFYHISSVNDLVMDKLGAIDVHPECFQIDIAEIDVILVSGMAFDHDFNVLNVGDNEELYKALLNKSNAIKVGVCFEDQIYRESLPESEYKVDCLMTEDGLYMPIDVQEV